MSKKKLYVVWNKTMNECAGFYDRNDAIYASTGESTGFSVSTLAESFREIYADEHEDVLPMTEVEVDV